MYKDIKRKQQNDLFALHKAILGVLTDHAWDIGTHLAEYEPIDCEACAEELTEACISYFKNSMSRESHVLRVLTNGYNETRDIK
jgi:hypothetical protein